MLSSVDAYIFSLLSGPDRAFTVSFVDQQLNLDDESEESDLVDM